MIAGLSAVYIHSFAPLVSNAMEIDDDAADHPPWPP